MTVVRDRRPLFRRPRELGRRLAFLVLSVVLKAYGAAAAASVALSDAETVTGKAYDGLNAVPNLKERYDEARYVVDHREQIQAFVDYARDHAPDPVQLDAAVQQSSATLERIRTTYDEVALARETFQSIRPTNVFRTVPEVREHVTAAWEAIPPLDSIENLQDRAQQTEALLRQVNLQDPKVQEVYSGLRSVMDNFASDEIAATLTLMALALLLGLLLGTAASFWGRRGRPGVLARILQTWGTRRFHGWYADNLEFAMSAPLLAVARERVQADLVADPRGTLDPQAYRALERHFAQRRDEKGVGGRVGL